MFASQEYNCCSLHRWSQPTQCTFFTNTFTDHMEPWLHHHKQKWPPFLSAYGVAHHLPHMAVREVSAPRIVRIMRWLLFWCWWWLTRIKVSSNNFVWINLNEQNKPRVLPEHRTLPFRWLRIFKKRQQAWPFRAERWAIWHLGANVKRLKAGRLHGGGKI